MLVKGLPDMQHCVKFVKVKIRRESVTLVSVQNTTYLYENSTIKVDLKMLYFTDHVMLITHLSFVLITTTLVLRDNPPNPN